MPWMSTKKSLESPSEAFLTSEPNTNWKKNIFQASAHRAFSLLKRKTRMQQRECKQRGCKQRGCKQRGCKQQAPSPTSSRRQQEKISTVVMPFVDGVTQPLQRVLKPLNIRVVGKPATWKWCLQHLLKESLNRDEEPGVVYRLTCNYCDQTYIDETGRTAITRAKEHASYVRNGRFDMSAAEDHEVIHQHSLSFKTVQIVDHEPRAARRRVKEALHIRTEKNPINKDNCKGLELDPIWFSVVWIFSYRDQLYANFPNSEPSPKLLRFFPFALLHFTFGQRLFTTYPHVSDYILLKTQMGNENRWQIEFLRRFGVYTFFREWEDPRSAWILSLSEEGVYAETSEKILSIICSRYPFVSLIKCNLLHFTFLFLCFSRLHAF